MENTEKVKPNQIYCGDSLEILSRMEDEGIHCSASSPPYFSLRKYQGAQTCEWPAIEYSPISGLPPIHIEEMTCALGHESTIEAYIGHLVAVYREVHRVLRNDGCAWLVMGDSYNTNAGFSRCTPDFKRDGRIGGSSDKRAISGLAQGDLMMVPHRLALALQADGWIVRNDVVWHKKSPMPESVSGWKRERHKVKVKKSDRANNVYQSGAGTKQGAGVASRAQREAYYEQGKGASEYTNCPGCPKCEPNGGYILKQGSWRHTRAHEFVFMMVKKMQYFANQEAVKEPVKLESIERTKYEFNSMQNIRDHPSGHGHTGNKSQAVNPAGRNPRSVLSPKPEPFSGRHFAVYPSTLIKSLIEATCPARCCPECGKGWAPVVEKQYDSEQVPDKWRKTYRGKADLDLDYYKEYHQSDGKSISEIYAATLATKRNILGYRPTCDCWESQVHDGPVPFHPMQKWFDQLDWVPGVVLDPFVGSGTTCIVAKQLGRRWIGIDISLEYCGLAWGRIDATQAPLFVL